MIRIYKLVPSVQRMLVVAYASGFIRWNRSMMSSTCLIGNYPFVESSEVSLCLFLLALNTLEDSSLLPTAYCLSFKQSCEGFLFRVPLRKVFLLRQFSLASWPTSETLLFSSLANFEDVKIVPLWPIGASWFLMQFNYCLF